MRLFHIVVAPDVSSVGLHSKPLLATPQCLNIYLHNTHYEDDCLFSSLSVAARHLLCRKMVAPSFAGAEAVAVAVGGKSL